MSQLRRSKRLRGENIQNEDSGPSTSSATPSRARQPKEAKSDMDDTVDYAALVDNYLADERLARQLQDEEQNVVTSRSSLPPITQRIMTSVTRMSERDNSPITISSEDDESANQNRERLFRAQSEERTRQHFEERDFLHPFESDEDFSDEDGPHPFYTGYNRDESDDENMYEESDIPQRRSAVLAPMHVHMQNGRVSLSVHGNRSSVNSVIDAQAALRNVSGLGRRFTLFDRLLTDASLDGIFDQSLHDEPVGLSNAQINRLPRTKPTRSQINSSECTICMDTYKENDDLLTLPCFHIFHYNCIKPWFSGKHECPVCRADVRETGAPPTQG